MGIGSRIQKFMPLMAILPALTLFTMFVLFPTIGNLYFSFTNYNGNIDSFDWVGLKNYEYAFTTDLINVGDTIKVTAIFCILVTLIQNALAVVLAVLVNMKLRLRTFYRSVIFMPNILGVVVTGLIWTLLFDPYSGPVVKGFEMFGKDTALLGDPEMAIYLVVFVQVWMSVGYAMILYIAGLQGISATLYESARIDGASSWKSFLHITLPMLWPIITVNLMLSVIGSLKLFDIILVLTNGGPGMSTMTIGMYIFDNLFKSNLTQGYAAALSFIHFFIIAVVVAIFYRFLSARGKGYGW
ncbi:carbohydrate ABC transporter permease [Marinicrinis sediminis]|uniref:Carbohydrate ABC transporter permease n=1 Tax=Marinicrinis sediminis TaxID=1652465 RepID=A0ABW5RG69_9BACL